MCTISNTISSSNIESKQSTLGSMALASSDTRSVIRTTAASFGYMLEEEQESALKAFVSSRDVFVSLPTGVWEVIVNGLLPSIFDILRNVQKASIAIVVSPLISWMKDQTDALNQRKHSQIKHTINNNYELRVRGI